MRKSLFVTIAVLLALASLNTGLVLLTGGYSLSLGPIKTSSHDAGKSFLLVLFLAVILRLFFIKKTLAAQEQETTEGRGARRWPLPREIAAALVLIIVCVLAIYHQTLGGYFLSDDFEFLSLVRSSGPLSQDVLFGYFKKFGIIRPLAMASIGMDYSLWSLYPFGYHLTNVLLHIANSLLVFFVLFFLRRRFVLSVSCALLFAAFPVHQETVIWISCRADLLCAFFSLLALGCYLYSRRAEGGPAAAYILSLIFFILALGSKEMAMALPLVIVLFDLFRLPIKRLLRAQHLKLYAPYFFILAGYVVFRVLFLGSMGGYTEQQQRLFSFNREFLYDLRNLLTRPLESLFLPVNESLFDNYLILRAALILLISAFVLWLTFRRKKNSPLIGLGVLLIIIAVIPAFKILHVSRALQGSRFLYLAALGACLVLAGALDGFYQGKKSIARAAAATGFVVLMAFFLWTSSVHTSAWKQAGRISKEIVTTGRNLLATVQPGSQVFVISLPDNYKGAYVFRNGFASAMSLAGIPEGVRVAELWKIPPSQIEKKNQYLLLNWENGSFRFQIVSLEQLLVIMKKSGDHSSF